MLEVISDLRGTGFHLGYITVLCGFWQGFAATVMYCTGRTVGICIVNCANILVSFLEPLPFSASVYHLVQNILTRALRLMS